MDLYKRISADNAAMLFVDHQTGLIPLVQDFSPEAFNRNVLALIDSTKFFKLPSIVTTSFEKGPNGPMMPEFKKILPDATYIPRPGQINAWDDQEFVNAVKKTGKKQLIISGIVTDVCVVFPALSALQAGYEVFVVVDASGTFNEVNRYSAWNRMSNAGAQLLSWFSVVSELQRDWRNDVEGFGDLLRKHLPMMNVIATSFNNK